MDANMIRAGVSLTGLLLMAASFLMHSYKKITVNYTVVWERSFYLKNSEQVR